MQKFSIEKLRSMPKAYIVVILMAVVVLFLMIFGGGTETLNGDGDESGKKNSYEEVSFSVKSWEEYTNEDGFPESLIIHSNEFPADFEVDPMKVSDYEAMVSSIEVNSKLTAKIVKADKKNLHKAGKDITLVRLADTRSRKVFFGEQ